MAMLCLQVSGVIIHHKLFSEFFTLRLHRAFGRSTLDVHNVASVALLPLPANHPVWADAVGRRHVDRRTDLELARTVAGPALASPSSG